MILSAGGCRALVLLLSLFVLAVACSGVGQLERTVPLQTRPSAVTTATPSAPCLAVPAELWTAEREFFGGVQREHLSCPPGPAKDSSQALAWLRSGNSNLAIVGGRSPGAGAELVREEPFVPVVHVTSALDDVPWSWLREVFRRGGEATVVIAEGGEAVKELLGLDGLAPQAVYVSSWDEAREWVATDRSALSLLPWRVVDFHVRELSVDGQRMSMQGLDSHRYQRHWWLVGDVEDYPDVCQELREGLAYVAEPLVSLVAAGDVMLGRAVGELIAAKSPSYPFLLTHELISQADLAFANLECPITSQGVPRGAIAFRAPPQAAGGLSFAGFDVVSLANNHSDDCGDVGLLDTLTHLEQQGIAYVGVGQQTGESGGATIVDVRGVRIAFLAYNHIGSKYEADVQDVSGPVWLEPEEMCEDVRQAQDQADFVVVSFHWGTEYIPLPDDFQVEVARAAVEAGADLVLGHHPHVVGAVSYLEDGFVAYSLGNFVFDQPFSVETMQGLVVHGLLDAGGLKQVRLIPVQIEAGQPRIVPSPEARKVVADVFQISGTLGDLPQDRPGDMEGEPRGDHLDTEWSTSLDGRVEALQACDLDNDMEFEIIVATGSAPGSACLHALNGDGSVRWQYEIQGQVNDLACGDLEGDGDAEVLAVTGLLDAPGEVYALDSEGLLRWRFGVEASLLDVTSGDLDAERRSEVVVGEWGSFGDTIYVFGVDGDLSWKRPTDGSVHAVLIADLNLDGRREVIAGADDLYVLASDGRLLWRYATGGYVREVAVAEINGDGSREVVAIPAFPDASVLALRSEGDLLWRSELAATANVLVSADIDRDGRDEVLLSSLDGTVSLLGGEGTPRWEYRGEETVNDLALADLNGDGREEVVVASGGYPSLGRIYVLDVVNGAVLGWYEVPGWASVIDVADTQAEAGDKIVVGTGNGGVLVLRWTTK